jgi:hypothetical protein
VKYYINLVLVDEENRRYFKQQEIVFWRLAEEDVKAMKTNALMTSCCNQNNVSIEERDEEKQTEK